LNQQIEFLLEQALSDAVKKPQNDQLGREKQSREILRLGSNNTRVLTALALACTGETSQSRRTILEALQESKPNIYSPVENHGWR
jgi:hypothetical protein